MANPSKIMLLGLFGREGSGKTSIANILTEQTDSFPMKCITDPIQYIIDVLFGIDVDEIWHMTKQQQRDIIENILSIFIDRDWIKNHPIERIYRVADDESSHQQTNWIETSFATPLKKIASLIFDIPFEILMARTEPTRKIRQEVITDYKNIDGQQLTGRTCLEYLGTDVFRKIFDDEIWVKIQNREISKLMASGNRVVISDVRFQNEMEFIERLNGEFFVVYRDERDLIISDRDKTTHISKWGWLSFYKSSKYREFLNPTSENWSIEMSEKLHLLLN